MKSGQSDRYNDLWQESLKAVKLDSNYPAQSALSQRNRLIGADELDARLLLRYKGQAPRKRNASNMNYYDHNILGLSNRMEKPEVQHQDFMKQKAENRNDLPLSSSIDNDVKRCKSQPAVFLITLINFIRLQEGKFQ